MWLHQELRARCVVEGVRGVHQGTCGRHDILLHVAHVNFSRTVLLTLPQGEKMRRKKLNALTLCIPLTSSCTMWIRCREREREISTRNGRTQLENAQLSKKSVASIGFARSRWSAWEHLSFTLSVSLSLSHHLLPCACTLSGAGSKLFEEIRCKKMSSMARKSQVERCLYFTTTTRIRSGSRTILWWLRSKGRRCSPTRDCRSMLNGHRPVTKNSCPPSGR